MKINTLALIEDCIERGVLNAIDNHSPCPENAYELQQRLQDEIWLQLDTYFTFNSCEDE